MLVVETLLTSQRNEAASQVYKTDVITKIIKEEGRDLFDSRSASLGHTLQGGIPSPLDRARAVRLSLKSMAFIEREHDKLMKQHPKTRHATPDSAAVITIQSSSVKWGACAGYGATRRYEESSWSEPVVGIDEGAGGGTGGSASNREAS